MRRILISVTNKTGIEQFKKLVDTGKWEILASDGTAKALEAHDIPTTPVEYVTNFPELLGGRLKTIHPKIFGGILADRSKQEHLMSLELHSIGLIDIVAVNLYAFSEKPGIENIDIGGPSLLRAAAKNGRFTIPVVDPTDYDSVISQILATGDIEVNLREHLVMKVFKHTAEYDKAISDWMEEQQSNEDAFLNPPVADHAH